MPGGFHRCHGDEPNGSPSEGQSSRKSATSLRKSPGHEKFEWVCIIVKKINGRLRSAVGERHVAAEPQTEARRSFGIRADASS
jgi:hypothetical protein